MVPSPGECIFPHNVKSRKYRGMFEEQSPENNDKFVKKDWSQQSEHMQLPKGRDQASGGLNVPCRSYNTKHGYNVFFFSICSLLGQNMALTCLFKWNIINGPNNSKSDKE